MCIDYMRHLFLIQVIVNNNYKMQVENDLILNHKHLNAIFTIRCESLKTIGVLSKLSFLHEETIFSSALFDFTRENSH